MAVPASIDLRDYIRNIPDFPKPGVMFKDITPLLGSPLAFRSAIEQIEQHFQGQGIDVIAAAEARGFIFGPPLAMRMGAGFVPIRKPGKLPYATLAQEYQLEYGSDRLEVHTDALAAGRRVLLLDDVLATGGTMRACRDLVQSHRRSDRARPAPSPARDRALVPRRSRPQLEPAEVFSLITY